MPPQSSDLAAAILRSAVDGYYPEADIAGTELAPSHLPAIIETLRQAKEAVKEEVRKNSRDQAPELDSWIAQARRLHGDIAASKSKADDILRLAGEEQALARTLDDAETQRRFLLDEISFNQDLAAILGKLQLIGATFLQIDAALGYGELSQAVAVLESAEHALEKLTGVDEIIVVGLLKERARTLRTSLVERVQGAWGALVRVDRDRIVIRRTVEVNNVKVEGSEVVAALDLLGLLKGKVDHLHQQLDRLLIAPRLDTQEGQIPSLAVDEDAGCLRIVDRNSSSGATQLFADLLLMIRFLQARLPSGVTSILSRILIPNLTNRLISIRLLWSVPAALEHLAAFEELLREARQFENELVAMHWTESRELSEWADRAPKVWLAKRREASLDGARQLLAAGIGAVTTVERSETQTLSAEDGQAAAAAGVTGADDWNEEWRDEEDEQSKPAQKTQEQKPDEPAPLQILDDDDDDVAGWGLDEDLDLDDDDKPETEAPVETPAAAETPAPAETPTQPEKPASASSAPDDDEDMDWGAWGADDDEAEPSHSTPAQEPAPAASASPSANAPPQAQGTKDVTLTETYTITSIPASLMLTISTVLSEAVELSTNPAYTASSVAAAATGLRSLPTLILAVYRALAPLHYPQDLAANMYMYNDSAYLSSAIESCSYAAASKDAAATSTFGRRRYTAELDAQRTILLDYLDGAQGFAACTTPPQSTACDSAIDAAVARLLELHAAWQPVLSTSALYQSLGGLLASVVAKLINDIEDLGDIGEGESARLARYIEDMAALVEPLFVGRADGPPVVAVYCENWLKLRYLQQILDGSMRDILFLLREGCLVEFGREELAELVEALFADTENRRSCLDEIRSGRALAR